MREAIRVGFEKGGRFDRASRIEWLDMEAITSSTALIIGAGALGNEVAKNLALSGFQALTIIDPDHVERSNLSRCVFFDEEDVVENGKKAECLANAVSDLSEDIETSFISSTIEKAPNSIFREHDLIFGCLDNINSRLFSNSRAYAADTPYLDGGIQGTIGRVFISTPPKGPCLECVSNKAHSP